MANTEKRMTFALQNGNLIDIEQVESGLRCQCTCPACGEALIAKKGQKTMHHFAHQADSSCSQGYETSLHIAAKEVFANAGKIKIPPVYVEFKNSGKERELLSPAQFIQIDNVELEKHMDTIVPDVVIYSGNKRLLVEIQVTHSVDKTKLVKLQETEISCLEIDLHDAEFSSLEELKVLLLEKECKKKWVYNTAAEKWRCLYSAAAIPLKITSRLVHSYVGNCPICTRSWREKKYANVMDDCSYCPYNYELIYKEPEGSEIYPELDAVLCLGKTRVSTLEELKVFLHKQKTARP